MILAIADARAPIGEVMHWIQGFIPGIKVI